VSGNASSAVAPRGSSALFHAIVGPRPTRACGPGLADTLPNLSNGSKPESTNGRVFGCQSYAGDGCRRSNAYWAAVHRRRCAGGIWGRIQSNHFRVG
jgi:hypothetical protein